jgi:hypothetical protein
MNHLRNEELQEFADGFYDEQIRAQIELHLRTCTDCRARVEGLAKLRDIIRRVPAERVSYSFTNRVMRRIGVRESSSFLWFLLKNIAPIIGLFIVVGIVYVALTFTGIVDTSGIGQSDGTINTIYDKFSGELTTATSAFNGWLKRIFPFLYSKTSYSLIAVLVVIIIAALLDKYLLIPIFRRRG